ncbi:hypothetical protein SAMN04488103_102405 [Gemmobacter aquatilis]|uniref:Uncharacterized protein n=1 Tax=Gemmobacter aquatilis TaxID=933059 RepID=A0A1H8C8P9_9RHOB|nr:hypothetical protein [Gemmobacter aquatilis]SEM90628.1 hypothetical protein SAMN04488103_102405 [Gemmobacter aquatilis]
MFQIKYLVATLTLAVLASPVVADVTTYSCTITARQRGSWVPPGFTVAHDPAMKSVVVQDPVLDKYNAKPTGGRLVTDSAQRISFRWEAKGLRNRANQRTVSMQYYMSYFKATGKVMLTAKPLGYPNNFRGDGVCKLKG